MTLEWLTPALLVLLLIVTLWLALRAGRAPLKGLADEIHGAVRARRPAARA